MVELLFFLILFELILFVAIDYYKFNTIFTPVFFLGMPFSFVLFWAIFVCSHLGFLPVYEYAVVVWCIGLLVFWLPGFMLTLATIENKISFPFFNNKSDRYATSFIRYISWFFIFFLCVSSLRSYLVHGTISGEDFSADFASQGLAAHCLSLMKFNAAYLSGVNDKKKYQNVFIILLAFLFLFLYNAKGAIILTAAVCMFSKLIMSRRKFNVIKIFTFVLLGTTFFALSYVIALGKISADFIIPHFFAYVIAGIVGLGEHLRQGLPTDTDFWIIVQPIRNLYAVITGSDVAPRISDFWVTTSIVHAKASNVKTFFGDIFIYAGVIKGLLVTSILGITSYLILILTIKYTNLTYLVLYLFLISSLMLGWFNYYFNDLFYYEVVVYAFLVIVVGKLFRFLRLQIV